MKHLAAYLLLKLGGNDSPTADDVTKALSSVGVEVDADKLSRMMADLDGKDLSEIMAQGNALLAKFGGGGSGGGGAAAGGGGAAAEEEKEEEKPEEEEMDLGGTLLYISLVEGIVLVFCTFVLSSLVFPFPAGGMDMFGGEGGGGDY